MNPFTAHPKQQGITYFEHWCFAMDIAYHLLASLVAFVLHAMLPFIPIAQRLDLEATTAYLRERNRWIENAKASSASIPSPASKSSNRARNNSFIRSQNERRNAVVTEMN